MPYAIQVNLCVSHGLLRYCLWLFVLKNPKQCIWIITRDSRRVSITALHKDYHLDYLVNRRHKHVLHYGYKGINNMCPPRFCKLFPLVNSRDYTTTTRSSSSLNVMTPFFSLEFARKSFSCRGPVYWNFLDHEIQAAMSFPSFKSKLNNSDMFT